ncbi:MAG: efflux RND transporter permease subunit, partial [Planctomycetaceae bacterium]|nr:efflux RND transporter permease subunit [Planctomycetaceae bacterium]
RARRSGAAEVSRVSVRGAAGTLVPLAELGSFAEVPEDPPIFHKDLERTVFVLGEVAGRPPAEAVFAMQASLARDPLPGGVTARWDGEGEWKVTLDVFRDLGLAFAGALVMIYVLLVATTGSFLMPLVVMVAIPLGAVAVMPGFLLLNGIAGGTVGGYADPVWFTATSMIGLIALSGIVVRNSILLIDFIEERTREGMALREAVLDAGAMRARPIMLTAGAVLLGAWPITLDPIFSGLAWALIFGVLASTLFSLLVVPVAYYALHLWRGGAGSPRVPPDSSSEASAST